MEIITPFSAIKLKKRANFHINKMKMQRISQYQTVLPLTTFGQNYTAYQAVFLETDLRKIWTLMKASV